LTKGLHVVKSQIRQMRQDVAFVFFDNALARTPPPYSHTYTLVLSYHSET